MKNLPEMQELCNLLDDKLFAERNSILLEQKYSLDDLATLYVKVFPKLRRYEGRMCILYRLVSYVRRDSKILDLAVLALSDRARIVRYHACSILAYSLRKEVLPPLESLLSHPDAETQLYAAAAIDAIEHQNHHYFVDIDHSGNVFWNP